MATSLALDTTVVRTAPPAGFDPDVRSALLARGVVLRRAEQEAATEHRDRLATALMALFRDERTEGAFQELYRWARLDVLHWLRSLLGRYAVPLDPHELLQDTFVNAFQYAGSFRDQHPGSFRVWIRTIGANVVRRALSKRSRFSLQALPEGVSEPVDGRGTPLCAAVDDEERCRLGLAWTLLLQHYLRAWSVLRPRDQRALQLVEVDGLTYAETSARLGVGSSNMKMIMFRSRQRIIHRMRLAMVGSASATTARRA